MDSMRLNREGYLVGDTHRECTQCECIFERTSKTVALCPTCNTARVIASDSRGKMLSRAKTRAEETDKDFNLLLEDIIIPIYCPVLGMELKVHKGSPGGRPDSPALDRVDNTKGYVRGNVQVISHRANMMKSDASPKELRDFAKWILENVPEGETV